MPAKLTHEFRTISDKTAIIIAIYEGSYFPEHY